MLSRGQQHKNETRKTVVTAIFVVSVFLFLGLVFGMEPVFADAGGDTFGVTEVNNSTGLGNADIRVIIGKIIRAALGLLGAVTVVIIMYGGFNIMTAAGNEEKVLKGRKIITNGVIGLVITMMAFTIAHWAITQLSKAINGSGSITTKTPTFATFSGSGSLGSVVKDHYPFRNERGVKRNTKLIVTFVEDIDPTSLVPEDTNGSGVLGDCNTNAADFNFKTDCDAYDTGAFQVYRTDQEGSDNKELVEGSVSVLYQGPDQNEVHTFVFRPYDHLGVDGENVRYSVIVSNITKKDGNDAFAGQNVPFYSWEFETDGELDLSGPVVVDVNPESDSLVARNEYVIVNFNEPVDPTMVQGLVKEGKQPNYVQFTQTPVQPEGEWKITNGYRTIEFHSSDQCGLNSCGEPLYCLPATCEEGDCDTLYNVFLRAATLFKTTSFEAVPFSGVMDLAGNALDGNGDGVPNKNPGGATLEELGAADNYLWSFTIKNEIDRSAPYIQHISPAIDKEEVVGQEPVKIQYNRKMLFSSFYPETAEDGKPLDIVEYPKAVIPEGIEGAGEEISMWAQPYSSNKTLQEGDKFIFKTVTDVTHREFGPNGEDFYYFPFMDQRLRASNGNCMHPGRGPEGDKNTAPTCRYSIDANGIVTQDVNCVGVQVTDNAGKVDENNDTGCIISLGQGFDTEQPDIAQCITELKVDTVSPL